MADATPTQAMGGDSPPKGAEGTNMPAGKGAESAGGPYPNPHTGKEGRQGSKSKWHGGQTEAAYHGTGQLGEQKTDPEGNPNSGSRS